MPRAKIDWNKILDAIKERHAEIVEFGVHKFNPRFLHYYFKQSRSELELGKLNDPYGSLNAHLVRWRKSGELSREWFYDDSRLDVEDLPDETPEEYAKRQAGYVESSAEDYEVYRWYKQRVYVEVWVEKNAMHPIVKQILNGKQVRVVACRGFISDSKLHDHTKRLARIQLREDKKIVILYLGDLDPSGENMDKKLPERLDEMNTGLDVWNEEKFECKRIAVTMEQVNKYRLLKLGPDSQTGDDQETSEARKKLLKDPRRKEFAAEHSGELFCVELDAMAAKGALEELAKIVKNEVENYYDNEIWEKYKPYLDKDNAKKWLIEKYGDAIDSIKYGWELDVDDPPVSLEDVEG